MKQEIYTSNANATTGCAYQAGMDYDRGFYSSTEHDCIDAPEYVPSGSFIENVIDYRTEDNNGRFVIPGITHRG